jgi:uncharacterized protein YjiS (DUF1127 family)
MNSAIPREWAPETKENAMSDVTFTHNSTHHAAASAVSGVLALARRVVQRFNERRTLNYLLSLPDYQLKDIGIQRSDIQREAIKPLWRI